MLGAWADHFVASRDLVTSALPGWLDVTRLMWRDPGSAYCRGG